MHLATILAGLLLAASSWAQEPPPPDLTQLADQVVTAVTDGAYSMAKQQAQQCIQDLERLDKPPDTQALATLWQSLATIGVYDEQPELVAPNLKQACAVSTEWFNERLGSAMREQWQQTCKEVQPTAHVEVTSLLKESRLYVDGRHYEEHMVGLAPGKHLVQVLTEGHPHYSAVVQLAKGQSTTLHIGLEPASAPARARHVALGAGTGLALASASGLVWSAAQAHGTWQASSDSCREKLGGCSEASLSEIESVQRQRNLLVGASAAGGLLSLGLGTALVVTW